MKNNICLELILCFFFLINPLTIQNGMTQTTDLPLDTSSLDESFNEEIESGQNSSEGTNIKTDSDISEPAVDPISDGSSTNQTTLWGLIKASGWVGLIIFLLSVSACALVIQFLLTLRMSLLAPKHFVSKIASFIEQGQIRSAYDFCANDSSMLGRVLIRGLKELDGSWKDVEKSLEDSLAEETAILYRRVEYLSVIGNIAPMLGLLGTVLGMVIAFGDLAASDGLARNLAQGIYFALMTTVEGLLVAIPSLAAFAFFNNRVAALSSKLSQQIEDLFRPIKKRLVVSENLKDKKNVLSPQSQPFVSVPAAKPPKITRLEGLEEITEKETYSERPIPSLKPRN